MPESGTEATYLELSIESENGHVFVRSKQVPGLHLIGKCFQAMKPNIEAAIKRLFRDNQSKDVNLIWLVDTQAPSSAADVLQRLAVYPAKKAA